MVKHEQHGWAWWKTALVFLGLLFALLYAVLASGAAIVALWKGQWDNVLDAGKDAGAGAVGIGVFIGIWRKYGSIALKEKASVRGYALSRAIEDWRNADRFARQLSEKARAAAGKLQETDGPGTKGRIKAEGLALRAEEAKARAGEAWQRVGSAMQSLHAQFPEDHQLTEDLQHLFGDKSTPGSTSPPH
jgi:hypothetical protein